ncbi:YueI family protein [Halalkalibacterium ligniniphilum]|uniref:YueI family protein n=1 Tax=Halalkalibacterium ligniniphilum TaxID=1134413 RepID=UPI00034D3BD1|nr:YueI family protein [Halalkalibacterium ligniniphilum]
MTKKIQDVINQALYGTPEVLPEERAIFLTTISERIYLALTKRQVIQTGIYTEAQQMMENEADLHLYLNGHLSYQQYAHYLQKANDLRIPFTIVSPNKPTPIGLVLANPKEAIERQSIFVEDEFFKADMKGGQ